MRTDEKATLGLQLVNSIESLTKEEIKKNSSLDEEWDLVVDRELIEEEVLTSEKFFMAFRHTFRALWQESLDETTYKERQAESERRATERTDRQSFKAEKNRVANSVNKRT